MRDRLDWELVEGAYELVSMLDPSRNTHISRNQLNHLEKLVLEAIILKVAQNNLGISNRS